MGQRLDRPDVGSVAANGGRFDFADEPALDIDQQAPGPDDFHFKYMDGSLMGPGGFFWWEWNRRASESATRFTQCVEQTAPGQLTYTRDLPVDANGDGVIDPGVAETVTRTGAGDMPDGTVRVIFQDGSYNPEKHGGHRRHHLALGQHHHQLIAGRREKHDASGDPLDEYEGSRRAEGDNR